MILFAACGRAEITNFNTTKNELRTTTCRDFFVAFHLKDERTAVTIEVDREKAGISVGTNQVDPSKVTFIVDRFDQPFDGYYCNDVRSTLVPSKFGAHAKSITVTLERTPVSIFDRYPLRIEATDVELENGEKIPSLKADVLANFRPG